MILNLTQHTATPEQIAESVVDLPPAKREALIELLTFEALPTAEEIYNRAQDIAMLAVFNNLGGEEDSPHPEAAMIGGAPYLMSQLERCLQLHSIKPVYAFSKREVVETPQADGSVKKLAVFRHAGWVECQSE